MFVYDRERDEYVMRRQEKQERNYFRDNQKRKIEKTTEKITKSARQSLQQFLKTKYKYLDPVPYELPNQQPKNCLNVDVISIKDIEKPTNHRLKMLSVFPVGQEKQQFRQFLEELDDDPYYQEAVMMFAYSLFKK